jgi:hypothetical protein
MESGKYSQYAIRVWDAAVIMVGHACLGAVTVVCMWGLEHLIETLGQGKAMLVYGQWPLEYLFQTVDLAMVLVIAVYGLWEMIGVLTGRRPL